MTRFLCFTFLILLGIIDISFALERVTDMAIKRIELENFTVFEKTAIDFCDGINLIIGENGTGKHIF